MADYGWKITRDHLDGADAGVYGPRGITPDQIATLDRAAKGTTRAFRMYDDDGELYYSGRYVGPDDECMFGPLDDWGTPNAGATDIRYWEHGKWERL